MKIYVVTYKATGMLALGLAFASRERAEKAHQQLEGNIERAPQTQVKELELVNGD